MEGEITLHPAFAKEINDQLAWLKDRAATLTQERDEAREAAREAVRAFYRAEDPSEFEAWYEDQALSLWPWLRGPGEEPAARAGEEEG